MKTFYWLVIVGLFLFSATHHAFANMNCGFAPIPPFGCRAVCYCDASGKNCTWQYVCK